MRLSLSRELREGCLIIYNLPEEKPGLEGEEENRNKYLY